ncbi:AIPR family protein [Actinoplanes regularis]|uniref:AIPR protein n=1 Tax=Actinoplanes regularis TaxID=52697 RepID=A0A239BB12_9ACTN|nr:AIPR family protein [Actinoplanes regularis]GIE87831.1 hypothetical protein Are01nite_43110 [Actinoplanes regularis]SNS04193.1 AIPR protein [Actinoplanes regularis]
MRSERFDSVEVRCVTRDELCELYRRASQAVAANFEMPKKLALPRMPGVEQSLFGLLPAVITGIIAATNRQTAVSEEELSVREDFHRSLEQWSAAHPAPHRLWYERRSKQYATRPEVEKTRVVNRGAADPGVRRDVPR